MPNRDSFRGLRSYLKIGIPSCFLVCLEFWGFELMTFLSAYLSVDETAA
jgi:hypothetical protein